MAHKTARSLVITTPVIRGAYFFLHEKRTKDADKQPIPEDKQKYEFVGLIPKLDADPAKCANYKLFADLAMSAIAAQEEWRGNWPSGGNWPIKDGDSKVGKYPWMAGCWVINFSGNFQPKVAVMQNGVPTEIPARRVGVTDLYKSGDYCIASTYAFTYDQKSRGVKFDMEGVLFVAPGEAIGTATRSVDQMFGGAAIPSGTGMGTQPQGVSMAPTPAAPAPVPAAPAPVPAAAAPIAPPPAPAAPSPAPQYAAPPSPPAGYAPPPMPPMSPTGVPPMPPVAPAPSAAGLPPFPGR